MIYLRCLVVFLGGILFSSCSSVSSISDAVDMGITKVISRPNSYVVKNETVEIELHEREEDSVGHKALAGGVGGLAASYVAGEIIRGVEKAAKNFSVIYSGGARSVSLSRYSGFSVVRKINEVPVSTIRFEFVEEGGYSVVELREVTVDKAKAAVAWWDDDIDIVAKVKIVAPTQKDANAAWLSDDSMVAKNISLGETVTKFGGGIPSSGFFKIPASGTPFIISVTIQETADFHKIAERGAKLLGENKEDLNDKLIKALGGG